MAADTVEFDSCNNFWSSSHYTCNNTVFLLVLICV